MTPEILLIDDDAYASALRKRVLEKHGYRVQLALDGAAGVALADALNPALILMDHHLPGIKGPEVIAQLRDRLPNTPILVHSGYEYLCDLYPNAPDAFLTKGDSVENMLRTVAQHLCLAGRQI